MTLIDESPGLFFALANVVVYSVIGVEIALWTTPSVVFVVGALLLIASMAVGIGVWMHRLLGEEMSTRPAVAAQPSHGAAPIRAPQTRAERERRPRAAGGLPGAVA